MGHTSLDRFKRTYKKGDHLGDEGEAADAFFILISGEVGIYVGKGEQPVAVIEQPGAYFGEMAALLDQKRTATMVCESAVEVYALPIHTFETLITGNPQVGMKLIRSLARRLDAAIHGEPDPETADEDGAESQAA